MKRINFIFCWICLGLLACSSPSDPKKWDAHFQDAQGKWNHDLTWVIIKDIFTPPVASRIYAYSNIAVYEAFAQANPQYKSFAGQLHKLSPVPEAEDQLSCYPPMVAMIAFTTVAKDLVFGFEQVEKNEKEYLAAIDTLGMPSRIKSSSIAQGRKIGKHILAWANKDGYNERQALPDHDLKTEEDAWQPTPPSYMPAIEPHWNTLRTFVLDSATQFKPEIPTEFNTEKGSRFYEETMEVYNTVNRAGEEELEIAKFWDCNPNIAYTRGHVTMFYQKISPGGHWISITDLVTKGKGMAMDRKAEIFAITSLTLADAFISCWDEKYRSNVIRPETYINQYIDSTWKPLLETPAFPEYTSGHSVISSAAAGALTYMLGDNYAFVDSTELEFGLPAREFRSFYHASEEAAISRLYGGIHYRPAVENGLTQGRKISKFIMDHINTSEDLSSSQ